MIVEKLIRMANQIAANFDFGPDKPKAVDGVADHLRRFWTSAMKAEIIGYQQNGGTELNEIAAQAVARLAEEKSDAA
jgi:formate dehydrogenase subunit delta